MKYKMYYSIMLQSRLLEGGSTNIRLSSSSYDILMMDCDRFGFLKNGKANISYIISRLVRELTVYKDDLHHELLKKNNNDEKLVKSIENNIFDVYLKTLNYICDDFYTDVGYRVSMEFKEDIAKVFFETLEKYDMDFISYARSIIYEYCSRTDLQRELFINYTLVKNIKKAIKKESIVNIVNEGIQNEIIIVSIEPTLNGFNYLLGITPDKTMCYFLPLCKTERMRIEKTTMHIEQDDYKKVLEKFDQFIEENS